MGFRLVSGARPDLWIGQFDILDKKIFAHGISTRHGGRSRGCYSSLNLGLHVGDREDDVIENRRIFCKALGVDPENTATCQQVHGSKVARIRREDIGAGFRDFGKAIEDTDALITNIPGVPLMLFFADCTPILIADSVHKAVGLAHGGWKGTLAAIAAKTVEAMSREFGSRPKDMTAAIGPSIGPCCYQVGREVADRFREAFPDFADNILCIKGADIYLDLQKTNTLLLEKAGLRAENIENAGVCTCCNSSQFFSYRAEHGKTGRIAAVISVK